jgi:hypothetical protein
VGTEHEHKKTSDYCRVIIDDRGDPLKRHLPRFFFSFALQLAHWGFSF